MHKMHNHSLQGLVLDTSCPLPPWYWICVRQEQLGLCFPSGPSWG